MRNKDESLNENIVKKSQWFQLSNTYYDKVHSVEIPKGYYVKINSIDDSNGKKTYSIYFKSDKTSDELIEVICDTKQFDKLIRNKPKKDE